jgi:hypothetical protein
VATAPSSFLVVVRDVLCKPIILCAVSVANCLVPPKILEMGKLNKPQPSVKGAVSGDRKKETFERRKELDMKQKPSSTSANDDLAGIFSSLRLPKLTSTPTTAKAATPNNQTEKKANTGDGLYRPPAASVEMGDDDFFGEAAETSSKLSKKQKARLSAASAGAGVSKRSNEKEGVDRIITEDELRTLTSGKPEAGTTPNCPFECDCCF